MILDAHHHVWRYRPEDYGWIGPGMESLARDFEVKDLAAIAGPLGVSGSVVVQARQSIEETEWLIELAGQSDFVRGVVGWAPLANPSVGELLDKWSDDSKLCGVRHVVQDEPDEGFLARDDFNRGVAEVVRRGLTYDVLIFAQQLPAAIQFVDSHPEGRLVLDHLGKPPVKAGQIEPWRYQLEELAERPNVACKLSGLVTEADWKAWTPDSIRPYLDAALEAFGPDRLMFGSDWPVCLLATSYERWVEVIQDWAGRLSPNEQASFFHSAATRSYQLPGASA
ncbi:Amidohydrolase [Botrimarina colliarenosi]|uniref:Amidohydrolase n=1 Tax=Botrimarina colliarenosi TaxID=2528001 RepID=A0A5C6ADM7_9BACT|nr:amidohydrolase family protein [Botrimarina colliarenosi]TWT97719.1 Amidohydrolase [Botrimarina colliarenosi]